MLLRQPKKYTEKIVEFFKEGNLLVNLSNNKNININAVDKVLTTLVMNTSECRRKIQDLLDSYI